MVNGETHEQPQVEPIASLGEYALGLKSQLQANAEQRIDVSLQEAVNAITRFSANTLPDEIPSSMRDSSLYPSTLFTLREIGLLEQVLSVPLYKKATIETGSETVVVERFSQANVGLLFLTGKDTSSLKATVRDSLARTSAARSLLSALTRASSLGDATADALYFKPQEDLLSFATIIDVQNLLRMTINSNQLPTSDTIDQFIGDITKRLLQSKALFDESGAITKVAFALNDGVTMELVPKTGPVPKTELLNAEWSFHIITDVSVPMLESANQAPHVKCEAFINRPTGEQLCAALEQAGLQFTPDFEMFLTNGRSESFSSRYGGAYTILSRVLAKIVWSADLHKLDAILISKDGQSASREQLESLSLFATTDVGLQHWLDLLKQLIHRTDFSGEVDPTESEINIQDYACFDVTSFYLQSFEFGKLYSRPVQNKEFLLKTHGGRTMINCVPVRYNGVLLPKGCLFNIGSDSKLAFLRMTPFMFDTKEAMLSAFGTEVLKAEQGSEVDIEDILERMNQSQGSQQEEAYVYH